jgi:hypothetical protein
MSINHLGDFSFGRDVVLASAAHEADKHENVFHGDFFTSFQNTTTNLALLAVPALSGGTVALDTPLSACAAPRAL